MIKVFKSLSLRHSRLLDVCGEQRPTCLVWSKERAVVAHVTEKVNAGYDRKVSGHPGHRSLQWTCVDADWSVCPFWPLCTAESTYNGYISTRTGTWNNKSMERRTKMHRVKKAGEGSVMHLQCSDGKPWVLACRGCFFHTYHLLKHCCRPDTSLHGNRFDP